MLLIIFFWLLINKDKIIFNFITNYFLSFNFFPKIYICFFVTLLCIFYGYYPQYFNSLLYFNFLLTITTVSFESLRLLSYIVKSFLLKKKTLIKFPIPLDNLENLSLTHLIICDILFFKLFSLWFLLFKGITKQLNSNKDNVKILTLILVIRFLGYPIFFFINFLRIVDFLISCTLGSNLKKKNITRWPFIIFYHVKISYLFWIEQKNTNLLPFFKNINLEVNSGYISFIKKFNYF